MASRIVSILTLGVADLERSTAFYEGLGFKRSQKSSEEITWFATGGTVIALYPWGELADDATVPREGTGFRGVTMAINLRSEAEVDLSSARPRGWAGGSSKRPRRSSGAATPRTSRTLTATCGRSPSIRSPR